MANTSTRSAHWIAGGAILAGLAVAAGAFGAHALRERLSSGDLGTFETAARYQVYHALALMLVGRLIGTDESRGWSIACRLFLVGILLFSGSLYGMTLGGPRWLGAVTPLGGVAFLAGWVLVSLTALRRGRPTDSR